VAPSGERGDAPAPERPRRPEDIPLAESWIRD
jgi:hypothetical protein